MELKRWQPREQIVVPSKPPNSDRLAFIAVGKRICQGVRDQLRDAHAIARDSNWMEECVLISLRHGGLQFSHHLLEDRLQRLGGIDIQTDAAAETAAREIKYVIDEARHAQDAAMKQVEHFLRARAQVFLAQHGDPPANEANGLRRSCPSTA